MLHTYVFNIAHRYRSRMTRTTTYLAKGWSETTTVRSRFATSSQDPQFFGSFLFYHSPVHFSQTIMLLKILLNVLFGVLTLLLLIAVSYVKDTPLEKFASVFQKPDDFFRLRLI